MGCSAEPRRGPAPSRPGRHMASSSSVHLLGVALLDLLQHLVLVPALPHVFIVDDVCLVLFSGLGQLVGQCHQLPLHTLILLIAVIQDALTGQLGAVACVLCALVLQVLDMVAHQMGRGAAGLGEPSSPGTAPWSLQGQPGLLWPCAATP